MVLNTVYLILGLKGQGSGIGSSFGTFRTFSIQQVKLFAIFRDYENYICVIKLNGSAKEPNILIYFLFLPITQWCSISDVLFTGGRGVSDISVFKILLVKY